MSEQQIAVLIGLSQNAHLFKALYLSFKVASVLHIVETGSFDPLE